jgi:hypothetical protein
MPPGVSLPLDPADTQWVARVVYDGTLLSRPKKLTEIRQGSDVLFLYAPGLPHPLQVRPMYLEERPRWAFAPCDRCGTDQALDPPSIMVKTRFSAAPTRSVPVAFSAVCPCGGTMVLALLMGTGAANGA